MAQPTQLTPTEQDALVKQIGLAMLRVAPEDWEQLTVDYRAVGRYAESTGQVVYSDGGTEPWTMPGDLQGLFARLRAGMYREGRGTWFNARYRLDHPSSYNLEYDREEPVWEAPPPPQAYPDDLRLFPRTDDNVPDWLRRRLASAPPPPGPPPGTPPAGPPRFRVARIFDGPGEDGRPSVNRPQVDEIDIQDLLDYLDNAPMVGPARGYDVDRLDPAGRQSVPVAFHTDGTWIWPAAVNYYLREHDISPEPDLVEHIRRMRFQLPPVDDQTRNAAQMFLGPPPPGPRPAGPAPTRAMPVPAPVPAPKMPPPAAPPAAPVPPRAALPSQRPVGQELDHLRTRLEDLDVPETAYRIGAPSGRGWTMEQTDEGWRVGWHDRDWVAPAVFEDVADASAFLLGKLMLDTDRWAAGPKNPELPPEDHAFEPAPREDFAARAPKGPVGPPPGTPGYPSPPPGFTPPRAEPTHAMDYGLPGDEHGRPMEGPKGDYGRGDNGLFADAPSVDQSATRSRSDNGLPAHSDYGLDTPDPGENGRNDYGLTSREPSHSEASGRNDYGLDSPSESAHGLESGSRGDYGLASREPGHGLEGSGRGDYALEGSGRTEPGLAATGRELDEPGRNDYGLTSREPGHGLEGSPGRGDYGLDSSNHSEPSHGLESGSRGDYGLDTPSRGENGRGNFGLDAPGRGEPGRSDFGLDTPAHGEPSRAENGRGDFGLDAPGRGENGRGDFSPDAPARSEPGRGDYGLDTPGRSEPSRSDFSPDAPARSEPGRGDYGLDAPARGEPSRGESSRSDFGLDAPGRGESGRGDFGLAGAGRGEPAHGLPDHGRDESGRGEHSMDSPGPAHGLSDPPSPPRGEPLRTMAMEPLAAEPARGEPTVLAPRPTNGAAAAPPGSDWPINPLPGEPPLTLFRGKRVVELEPGTEIDRFGEDDGNLVYAAGTPFSERSLVPEWIDRPYHAYRVRQPVQVLTGAAIPWFDQPGGGTAYLLPDAIGDLVAHGHLVEIADRDRPRG